MQKVGEINGIQKVDINVMLDILKVVGFHCKYVHAAKLEQLINDRQNACKAVNFGIWN